MERLEREKRIEEQRQEQLRIQAEREKEIELFRLEREKKLEEARNKKKFVVRDDMINDWPGDRFLTTHRCFGGPCKGDRALLQLQE